MAKTKDHNDGSIFNLFHCINTIKMVNITSLSCRGAELCYSELLPDSYSGNANANYLSFMSTGNVYLADVIHRDS